MEFINQSLDLPKKTSLSVLNETYQEVSLQDMISHQESSGVLGPREKERNLLDQEKQQLEEDKKLLHAKIEAFEKLLQKHAEQIEEWKKEAVQYFSEVVFKISKAVLREELQLKPERLNDLILSLVQKTYGESERKLMLHPKNIQWMKENFPKFIPELEKKHQIIVKEEETIEENTFTLETSLHQYQENPFLNIEWLKKELYPSHDSK